MIETSPPEPITPDPGLHHAVSALRIVAYLMKRYQKRVRKFFNDNLDAAFATLTVRYKLEPEVHYFVAIGRHGLVNRFVVLEPHTLALLDKKTGLIERVPYADIKTIILPEHISFPKPSRHAVIHKTNGTTVEFKLSDELYDYKDIVVPKAKSDVYQWRVARIQQAYLRFAQACTERGLIVESPAWLNANKPRV